MTLEEIKVRRLAGQHLLAPTDMRDIFNLAGIVRPAILVNGTVVGWWNLKNRKLKITLFAPADQRLISETASHLWSDLKQIEYL